MAKITSVNLTPATGAEAIFDFIANLVAAGWIVEEDSDGTTHETDVPLNGRQTTSGGAGANGLNNANAWIRITDPAGAREWTFQRTTNSRTWRVKYSALDTFTGGTPGATETPSATDGQILHGSGTDAAPIGLSLFDADGLIGRWHCIAQDTVNARGVYSFWAFSSQPGGSIIRTIIMTEAMDPATIPPLVGTRAAPTTGDPDPCIVACSYISAGNRFATRNALGWNDTGSLIVQAWFGMNGTNGQAEAFLTHGSGYYAGDNSPAGTMVPAFTGSAGVGVSPYDGADEGFPIPIGRYLLTVATQLGFKGFCETLRQKGAPRVYPNTINLATDAYVYVDDILVPWENGTVPLQ